MDFFKKIFFMVLIVLRVFFPGAGRPLCSILRELYCMGVAVLLDARTMLIATRLRLLPFLAMPDCVRTHSTILCTPLRMRWWQGLQPVLGVSWTLLLLLHDVGRTIATVHVGTWAGGNNCLNLRISQEKEIMSRCAVLEFSPRTPFVTPVLPGPGSDIRMKMGWKVLDKTRKSGVWFSGMRRIGWVVRCGRCSWVR